MTQRHLLRVRADPADVIRALDSTSLSIKAATPDADLMEFQDGNGLIKAGHEGTGLQLLDDDEGAIVSEINAALHEHGYVVEHRTLDNLP